MKKSLFLSLCILFVSQLFAQTIVNQPITSNTTWSKNNVYHLDGFIYVKNNATLTIEAGTLIKGLKGSKGTLIVTRGAKVIANGTAQEPIVFTSNESSPTYGDWGGIILLGKAPTNTSADGVDGVGVIEGGVNNAEGDGKYGGTDANDNSGVLRYVRIEYPGIAFTDNNEINGITFGGVGAGTVVENVQVSYSGDDSFEWFGGTVNCKNLIAYRGLDDDFDCDFGFSGKIQNALAVRDPLVADASGSNGFEVDNDAAGSERLPKTAPTFSNVTIVDPIGGGIVAEYKRSAHLRRSNEIGIFNSIFVGQRPVGIFIDGSATEANATAGKLEIKNCFVAGQTEMLKGSANFDAAAWFNTAGWGNASFANISNLQLLDPAYLEDPNAQPLWSSPVYEGGSFTAARLQGGFFTTYNHAGAFDGANDWTCPWAAWSGGLNSDCNVRAEDFSKIVSSVSLMPTVVNNAAAFLQMTISEKTDLNVRILGLDGSYFGTPVNQQVSAGEYRFEIETAALASGFYLIQIEAGNSVRTEKMIVVR